MLALDNLKGSKNYKLFAKVYSDLGDICLVQSEYEDAKEKYNKAIEYCNLSGDVKEALYSNIDLGKTYRSQKEFVKARALFLESYESTSDSLLKGVALQEIGINFYYENKFDSAVFYLKSSLIYPYIKYAQALRNYHLSDSYYELKLYDSACVYANNALAYLGTFYTRRECYRILANTSYLKGDYKTMASYMTYYQSMTDSVRKIDIQTKSNVIENIHQTTERISMTKRWLWVSLSLIPLFLFVAILIFFKLRNRTKGAEVELEQKSEKLVEYEQKLHSNHEQLKNNLLFKMDEVRKREKANNRRMTLYEKQEFERKVFEECLYISDNIAFNKLMNFTFNNIVTKLNRLNPELSRNEVIYCCLVLLDLNSQEIILIIDVQLSSLYKLKQRLAQKLGLNSSTDVFPFLRNLWIS